MTSRRPDGGLTPSFRLAFMVRGLAVWIFLRVFMTSLWTAGLMPDRPGPVLIPYVLVLVFVLVLADGRVRKEDLLLGNAGVSPFRGPSVAALTASFLEAAMQLGTSLPW